MSLRALIPEGLRAPLRGAVRVAERILHPWIRFPVRRADNPYASHIPVLLGLARLRPIRRVLELGSGDYSTLTFLDRAAFPELTSLVSLEDDPTWLERVRARAGADPRVEFRAVAGTIAEAVDTLDLSAFDLVFVDDSMTTEARVRTIRAVATAIHTPTFAAIHDFECTDYREAATAAPRQFAFEVLHPNTGVMYENAPTERQLQQVRRVVDRYSRRLAPDDIQSWVRAFDRHLARA